MDAETEQHYWDACPDADHAVYWMIMDICPRDFERAIRAGKVAFLAKFLEIPTRLLVKRARAFKAEMIKEGVLSEDWCAERDEMEAMD